MYSVCQEYNKIYSVIKVGEVLERENTRNFDQDCALILVTVFAKLFSFVYACGEILNLAHSLLIIICLIKEKLNAFSIFTVEIVTETLTSEGAFIGYDYIYIFFFHLCNCSISCGITFSPKLSTDLHRKRKKKIYSVLIMIN